MRIPHFEGINALPPFALLADIEVHPVLSPADWERITERPGESAP